MYIKTILIFSTSFVLFSQAESQTLFIRNGKKKIKVLVHSKIEIQTRKSAPETGSVNQTPGFTVSKIESDSIEISGPTAWKDTFTYKFNSWTGKDKTNKKKYYKVPSAYESHRFALTEISKIKYTYQRDQSGEGCIGCLLIPGVNLYYLWRKAYRTKEFDMTVWSFIWK